jgi:hypothetical protein
MVAGREDAGFGCRWVGFGTYYTLSLNHLPAPSAKYQGADVIDVSRSALINLGKHSELPRHFSAVWTAASDALLINEDGKAIHSINTSSALEATVLHVPIAPTGAHLYQIGILPMSYDVVFSYCYSLSIDGNNPGNARDRLFLYSPET